MLHPVRSGAHIANFCFSMGNLAKTHGRHVYCTFYVISLKPCAHLDRQHVDVVRVVGRIQPTRKVGSSLHFEKQSQIKIRKALFGLLTSRY
jgi:hypothetical protein